MKECPICEQEKYIAARSGLCKDCDEESRYLTTKQYDLKHCKTYKDYLIEQKMLDYYERTQKYARYM